MYTYYDSWMVKTHYAEILRQAEKRARCDAAGQTANGKRSAGGVARSLLALLVLHLR
jgi:hypothetical protein